VIEMHATESRSRGKHRTILEAQALVAAWKNSGESPQRWCDSQGVRRTTLASCRRRVVGPAPNSHSLTNFVELLPKPSVPAQVRLSITSSGAQVELSLCDLACVIQSLAGRL